MKTFQDVPSSKKNKHTTLTDMCKDAGYVVKQFFPEKNTDFVIKPYVGEFK